MRVLILGVNGFIGSHLLDAILATTDWQVIGFDLGSHKIAHQMGHPHFVFEQGDLFQSSEWIAEQVKLADVVLPLIAIANPQIYVDNPLKVFELDFEANLPIVRLCVEHKTRLIFPSTSEVYGMCEDDAFEEYSSNCVLGPVTTPRWIYSNCKQLMDRLIVAYGQKEGLQYTLFRPFNWYGPRLDELKRGATQKSRVLTNFIGQILDGEPITLVDGGAQRRCFTYIADGIAALMLILHNVDGAADGRIFNIGNPYEDVSIKHLAETLLALAKETPALAETAQHVKLISQSGSAYYGKGYQDVKLRVPSIEEAKQHLQWTPVVSLAEGLQLTLDQLVDTAVMS